MTARVIRGQTAQIRWAYYVAAGVEGWTVTQHPPKAGRRPSWSVVARMVGRDAFKMAQRPLLFVTEVKQTRWVFPIEDFRIEGDRLIGTLGPRGDY